ncbi:MAG: hypothetical protein F6J89_10930 [Symploca sp. SIO1C4]|uniref:histidine kinase n=1 Tax=Symploca sp. SIO1C4 TaxID=2607765 RepID=A0A6B3NC04_9CYAN|nr:hypothetical protein [Symploca sp. SIO1C4]
MNLPRTPDLSIYQLALDNLASKQPLLVNHATLTSLVGSLIDVLIEAKIPATLWVKLLPSGGWQAELKRYLQLLDISQRIYLCSCSGNKLVEENVLIEQITDLKGKSCIFPVTLAAGSQLKQECFLIVLSEQFSTLIAACSLPKSNSTLAVASREIGPLLTVCTFEQRVIERVLKGLTEVMAVADNTPEELLGDLKTLLPQIWVTDAKELLTQLLLKQLERTDDVFEQQAISNHLAQPRKTTTASVPDYQQHKYEFLQRFAQELRTPLTNMKTALKLLDSPQSKSLQRRRYMQLLYLECERQNSLITGLVELAKLEDDLQLTVTEPVQVAEIVPGVVSTYQPIAQEQGIKLCYSLSPEIPPVLCLENWLRQIIINLLQNSLKFTSSSGQVMVVVTLQGKYVQLEFIDSGVGISADEIPKIFDSFYRGRSTTGEDIGAGLGLTIVQQLVRRCGGSITVTSKLNKGSNFKVMLPVATRRS